MTRQEDAVVAAAIRWYQVTWQRPRTPAEWSAGEIYNDWDRVHDLAIAVEHLIVRDPDQVKLSGETRATLVSSSADNRVDTDDGLN